MKRSSFKFRQRTTQELIGLLERFFWSRLPDRYEHFPVGYENLFETRIQEELKRIYDRTSVFLRFLPDYMVIDRENKRSWFIEYKVTKTPRYSEGERQWSIGQVEALAWQNYCDLAEIGAKVIVCIFCPYYKRPLLASFPNNNLVFRNRTEVKSSLGSGTPYVNVDLEKFKWFHDLISEELGIPKEEVCRLLDENFWRELRRNPYLQTTYHPKAPEEYRKKYIYWLNPCTARSQEG